MRRPLLFLALALLFAAFIASYAACTESSGGFVGSCSKNEECPVGAFCKKTKNAATGLCACRTDEACKAGEICNSQSVCQKRSACRSNMECGMGKFCDIASGNCIDRTGCGTDIHCVPGSVCDVRQGRCADGCFDDADCPLYAVCNRAGLTSTTALGSCLMGKCSDKSFCAYGYDCVNESCTRDPDPNHCKDCSQDRNCGSPSNFCLINSAYSPTNPRAGTQSFCGVECANEEDCPNGYNCGGVILLTQDQCTQDNQCGGGGRQCIIGEGDLRGFCTCAVDRDCTIDQAPPTCLKTCGGLGLQVCEQGNECPSGNCVPTGCQWPQGRNCTQDAQCDPLPLCAPVGPGGQLQCVTDGSFCAQSTDCLCFQNQCVFTGRPCTTAAQCGLSCQGGGCLLGKACAPESGLYCPDVRTN